MRHSTTRSTTAPSSTWPRAAWVAYAAALWALIFTFLHVAWAAGWYLALPQAEAQWAFSRRWFWIYDVVVAGACAVAVIVPVALVHQWGGRVVRRLVKLLAWSGTGLLLVRGGGGILQTVYLVATGQYTPQPMHLYELWFLLGGVLFAITVWRFGRPARGSAHGFQ